MKEFSLKRKDDKCRNEDKEKEKENINSRKIICNMTREYMFFLKKK